MSTIDTWLESLGLGEYADVFCENGVDFRALPALTEDDLKELGLKLGHRRVLQQAIAVLDRGEAGAVQQAASKYASPPQAPAAEHRQLTVMFCDLKDSVAFGERMDVEDYRDLLSRFRTAAVTAVERFGGYVARHQGDGILVYFGYPTAHEKDAERAVNAGLAVVDAIAALADSARPAVRVGIATGPTLVGDRLEAGGAHEFAALGTTPNLAARLQGEAEPNTVLVSATTRRVAGDAFRFRTTGPLELKGIAAPQAAYVVEEVAGREREMQAGEGREASALVGRDAELALLMDRWHKAAGGTAQVVLVSAEPGLGKSRLVRELRARTEDDSARVVTVYCSPYHGDSALYPVVDAVRRTLEAAADGADIDLDVLTAWLGSLALDARTAAPILAPLLSLNVAEVDQTSQPTGDALRRRTLDVFVSIVMALARDAPVLLIAEDLHWADPTTLELLDRIIDETRDRPLMTVLTYRPEFEVPWTTRAGTTSLALCNLTPDESRALFAGLETARELPEAVIEVIVRRTDGVPLFIEELTRTLSEADAPADAIPETLRDALVARLDRLGPAREVAQLAAVVGRQFSRSLLRALSEDSEAELEAALDTLLASGLVHRRRNAAGDGFEFKHALVRDAAYEGLLRERRRALHARVLAQLERGGDASTELPLELLAQHARAAERWDAVLEFAGRAGTRAASRGANAEAIALLDDAIAAARELSGSAERDRCVVRLVCELRGPLHALGRNERLEKELTSSLDLARRLGDRHVATLLNIFLSNLYRHRGQLDRALEAARRAHRDAVDIDDTMLIVCSAFDLAQAERAIGHLRRAVVAADAGLARIPAGADAESFGRPAPASVLLRFVRAQAFGDWGELDRAHRDGQDAVALADTIGQPFGRVAARYGAAYCEYLSGDLGASLATLDAVVALARMHRLRLWISIGETLRAEVLARTGRADEAVEVAREARAIEESLGYRMNGARILGVLAFAQHACGDSGVAARSLREALELAPGLDAMSEVWCGWIAGQILDDTAAARTATERALALAEQRELRPLAALCRAQLLGLGAGGSREAIDAELRGLGMSGWVGWI